jgi:hydroxymethylpyrimidine/phosphomethylpyrimidine kinase
MTASTQHARAERADPGRPIVALTIAGSDPSGGAGIQADLKTFSALGAYGCAVLTALTAQSTRGVAGVLPVPAEFVARQLDTLFDDVRIDAVKIGMLAEAPIIEAVADVLDRHQPPIVVLDPVMVATSGDRLLAADAEDALRRLLLPRAHLVTPNLGEAGVLLGRDPARDLGQRRAQVAQLLDLGARAVLLKGGHQAVRAEDGDPGGARVAVDLLGERGGARSAPIELRAPWIDTRNTHGTGCTLSSALAVQRARRADEDSWRGACEDARRYLSAALADADRLSIGHGHGPVSHFAAWPGWADGPARDPAL